MEINTAKVSYWEKLPMMHLLLLAISDKHSFYYKIPAQLEHELHKNGQT